MIAVECPKCNARPPDGDGHTCSDGSLVPPLDRPRFAMRPVVPTADQRAEADDRERMSMQLERDIADGFARAAAMARLEAELGRLA